MKLNTSERDILENILEGLIRDLDGRSYPKWIREAVELAIGHVGFLESHDPDTAAEMGRKGGQAKSERKTAAVRENGKKGGRPRKINNTEDNMKHESNCTCDDCNMEKGMRKLLDGSIPAMRRRDELLAEQGVSVDTGTPEQILAAWEQAQSEGL